MHYKLRPAIFLMALAIFGNPGCSRSQNAKRPSPPASSSTQTPAKTPDSEKGSGIRLIDFANFSYPWVSNLGNPKNKFTLKDGTFPGGKGELPTRLLSVTYGDLTNDNTEGAIVILDVTVKGGSASPNIVYLYSLIDGTPKLLWAFSTGDRKDGGLRRVYCEGGKLVVELYGKDKIIGSDLYADDGTEAETPFPYFYTRVRYAWNGTSFQRTAAAENISDPKDYGSPIMPVYRVK